MIRLMKSNKGASSVLVILLLVVLVVFGVAALTTALSNVRLGQKVVDWNEKYYAAEAQANEMYAEIDKTVWDVWSDYLMAASYPDNNVFIKRIEALDLDIESAVDEETIDFTYETWQEDVGIRVTLTLGIESNELTIAEWRVLQQ